MRVAGLAVALLIAGGLTLHARRPSLSVDVVDPTGTGLAQAYVIARRIKPWHEVMRGATDAAGHGPKAFVPPGLYQIIVMYPYDGWYGKDEDGNFQPVAVKEVLVESQNVSLRVTLWAAAIDRTVLGGVALRVALVSKSGAPAAGVLIMARNPQATYNVLGRSDAQGVANLDVERGSVVILAAADDKIATREVCIGETGSAASAKTQVSCIPIYRRGGRQQASVSIRLE